MLNLISEPYISFFLIVALGLLLGKISIKGISLDVSAVIFIALLFGHMGFSVPPVFQKIGLILFIYSVGIQAGPGFFGSLRKNGINLIKISVVVILSAAITGLTLSLFFEIETEMLVGLLTGALTSTPGLAAAIESTNSPLASIGYGIAYPFGVLGVILFVRFVPKIFLLDVEKAEQEYLKEVEKDYPKLHSRHFQIQNKNVFNKTIGELAIATMTGANISRILHGNKASTPGTETILQENDIVKAVGTNDSLDRLKILLGEESNEEIPLSKKYSVRRVLLTNKKIVNKTLGEIGLFSKFNATVTSIRRSGIDISPSANTHLRFGDKLMIASSEGGMKRVTKLLGDNSKLLNELDFLPVSIGIIIGVLIGQIDFPLPGGSTFSLGLTGGILTSAILLSKIGKTGAIIWNVSGNSNQLIRKIGLLFFLASVGTNAGEHLVESFQNSGLTLFLVGVVLTIVPMLIAFIFGHYVFKINLLCLLGTISGSMTSTPALSAIEPMTKTDAANVAYATVYPFALVMIIIVSQIFGMI